MNLQEMNESCQLNDMSLAAGKKRQSQQTGFVHHYYHEGDKAEHHTIPLVENFLFALALLQSKTIEQMTEAKEMIHKLLHFQNRESGNFPIYVHEYPECKDRFIGAQLLPVFYYILKDFRSILGEDLSTKLIEATKKCLKHCHDAYQEKEAPYPLALKIFSSTWGFGKLLKENDLEKIGSDQLEKYRKQGFHSCWCIPHSIADILLSLQIAYGELLSSPWADFVTHVRSTWHQPTATYVGPALRQYHKGKEADSGLYDLFLGSLSDHFSNRSLQDAAFHLQAALVKIKDEKFAEQSYPIHYQGLLNSGQWTVYQNVKYAYSVCEKCVLQNNAYENGFHPLYLVWGNLEHANTFVNQGGNFKSLSFTCKDDEIVLLGQLSEEFVVEDKEKCREQIFYFEIDPDTKITIDDMAASTFAMNETCVIANPALTISLSSKLIEGEGQFLGHIMRGNRPSQLQLKGENRFSAYDWQMFFRTLRRQPECKVMTTIKIKVD